STDAVVGVPEVSAGKERLFCPEPAQPERANASRLVEQMVRRLIASLHSVVIAYCEDRKDVHAHPMFLN
ncbi:MAG: hypothetical protein WBD20_07910, partial [Pirellulaceae bacterium]